MCRPSRKKASTCSRTARWCRWPTWSAPANLPPEVRARLIDAFPDRDPGPRFKEFAKQNAFLVDDMTGDALTKEVDDVAASIEAVAEQGISKE